MMEAHAVTEEKWFETSNAQYGKLKEQLQSAEFCRLPHSAVEDLLWCEGLELLRLLLQDHLTLRARTEQDVRERGPLKGRTGAEYRHRRRETTRGLMTVFGRVEVQRASYLAAGEPNLFPLDAELNLPADSFSHGVRKLMAREAANQSFEKAQATVTSMSGASLGKRQAENLANAAARDFERFYRERGQAAHSASSSGQLLVLSTDGKGVTMRPEGLREATREAAEREPSPPERIGEKKKKQRKKRHRKRMATVATVYTMKPHTRTPKEVTESLRGVVAVDYKQKRPRPENKRVWASLARPQSEVIHDAFNEAAQRDPGRDKRWVVLVDGDKNQLSAIREEVKTRELAPTIIVDLIHVLGYLWDAGKALHDGSSPELDKWVYERLKRILEGKASDVAAGMSRSATMRQMDDDARKPIDVCARYLLSNKDYLHYERYLADGFPIATGVIEGACRHLVQDRMAITGARWGLSGAEAILRLRALRVSGDFEDYWRYHLDQEKLLNHTMLYASSPPCTRPVPEVPQPAKKSHLQLVP